MVSDEYHWALQYRLGIDENHGVPACDFPSKTIDVIWTLCKLPAARWPRNILIYD